MHTNVEFKHMSISVYCQCLGIHNSVYIFRHFYDFTLLWQSSVNAQPHWNCNRLCVSVRVWVCACLCVFACLCLLTILQYIYCLAHRKPSTLVKRVHLCAVCRVWTQSSEHQQQLQYSWHNPKYMLNVEISGRTYHSVYLKFNKYEWVSSLLLRSLVRSLSLHAFLSLSAQFSPALHSV